MPNGRTMSESDRRLLGQLGAFTRLSRMTPQERREMTEPARAGKRRAALERVDPEGKLQPHEREQLAEYELQAQMRRLVLASAAARRGKPRRRRGGAA